MAKTIPIKNPKETTEEYRERLVTKLNKYYNKLPMFLKPKNT